MNGISEERTMSYVKILKQKSSCREIDTRRVLLASRSAVLVNFRLLRFWSRRYVFHVSTRPGCSQEVASDCTLCSSLLYTIYMLRSYSFKSLTEDFVCHRTRMFAFICRMHLVFYLSTRTYSSSSSSSPSASWLWGRAAGWFTTSWWFRGTARSSRLRPIVNENDSKE